jgi:hypothetical protein
MKNRSIGIYMAVLSAVVLVCCGALILGPERQCRR